MTDDKNDPKTRALAVAKERWTTVGQLLTSDGVQAQLKAALPKHITPERLARLVLTEIRRNPKLLECSTESLMGAVVTVAQLGLELGLLGQGWILPFNDKHRGMTATFIAGYRGLTQLAWRSSQIKSVKVRAVFEGDHFEYNLATDDLTHTRGAAGEEGRGANKLTHAYAVIVTIHDGMLWDVMTVREIEAIRKRAQAPNSPAWTRDYPEMAKKSVLKRLLKIAPASTELQKAVTLDDRADQGLEQWIELEPVDGTWTPPDDFGEAEKDDTPPPEPVPIDDADKHAIESACKNIAQKYEGVTWTEIRDTTVEAMSRETWDALTKAELPDFLEQVFSWDPPTSGE